MPHHPPPAPAPTAAAFAVPGGHTQALIDALCERLRVALADLKLQTDVEGEPPRAPRIYDGFLPPKRHKGDRSGEFPFVLVRPVSGSDAAENDAQVTLRLVIGVHSEEADGYRDWVAVKERIRLDLLQNRVLGGRFRFAYPMPWDLPEDQQVPQWLGSTDVTFVIPGIVENPWEGEIL